MKNNDIITKIAICFVLVPIVLIVLPYLISPIISEKYGQMTVDLIIFLVAIVLSQNIWHIKISFKLKEAFESIMPVNTEHFIFVIYSI